MTGNAESKNVLRGKLNGLKTIHGYSAYEVAVICGFSGTEEEWLVSLKGEPGYTPQKGIDYFDGKDGKNANIVAEEYTSADGKKHGVALTIYPAMGRAETYHIQDGSDAEVTNENVIEAIGYNPADEAAHKELCDAVFGVHPKDTILFDSKTDEFELGTINTKGAPVSSTNRWRIPKIDISSGNVKVRINSYNSNGIEPSSGHKVWIAQYDANNAFIAGSRKDITGTFEAIGEPGSFPIDDLKWIEQGKNGYGNGAETTIVPEDGAVYAYVYNFVAGTDIDIEVFIDGAENEGVEPRDGLVDDIDHIREDIDILRNDMEQLVPQYRPEVDHASLIATVFGKTSGDWYVTDFAAIALADLHGSITSLDDAISVRNSLTNKPVILNAGDMLYLMPKIGNVIDPVRNGRYEIAEYMERAKAGCVYHTMGQHEVGFKHSPVGATDARTKANCMTHDEVFNTFIAPMKEVWGLPDLTTNYYYKDFATQKMRLISLYQYNVPLVEDETDSTKYKYDRNMLWYGQAQLDWLVNTLNTVPDGYKVIILMHQLEKDVVVDDTDSTAFHDGETSTLYGDYVFSGKPTMEIVQAYIDRSALNKTYTPANTDKHPADLFTVTVNADFTNANGEFAHYLSGDVHVDFVGYAKGTRQRHIILTACNTSYDCYVNPTASGAERSIVNLLGYDYKHGFIRLGRVGQQYSLSGQMRVFEKVTI